MNAGSVLLDGCDEIATVILNRPVNLIARTGDLAQGLIAFFQRRKPEFKGEQHAHA